jgi:hypothetical protein
MQVTKNPNSYRDSVEHLIEHLDTRPEQALRRVLAKEQGLKKTLEYANRIFTEIVQRNTVFPSDQRGLTLCVSRRGRYQRPLIGLIKYINGKQNQSAEYKKIVDEAKRISTFADKVLGEINGIREKIKPINKVKKAEAVDAAQPVKRKRNNRSSEKILGPINQKIAKAEKEIGVLELAIKKTQDEINSNEGLLNNLQNKLLQIQQFEQIQQIERQLQPLQELQQHQQIHQMQISQDIEQLGLIQEMQECEKLKQYRLLVIDTKKKHLERESIILDVSKKALTCLKELEKEQRKMLATPKITKTTEAQSGSEKSGSGESGSQ